MIFVLPDGIHTVPNFLYTVNSYVPGFQQSPFHMTTSKKTIKLLLVDDSVDDRDLILMNLRRGGYRPDVTCVDTKKEFIGALEEKSWDLIICDYSMPGFDGLAALSILKDKNLDIPFILVSGAIGEELAVKAMKAGANDYLMKDSLQRLLPAIERELKEAELRKKHREAQRERDRLLSVIQNSLNEIYIFDCQTLRYSYLNQAAIDNLGYSTEELYRMSPIDINPDLATADDFKRITQPLLDGELEKDLYLTKHVRSDGSTYPIEIHLQLIRQNNQQFFTAIGFDLTDREKDAKRIQEQKEIAREFAEHSKHKSEFLANMSHELRTPLNSILLLSKLLLKSKNENLSKDQMKYIDVIQQSGNNLLSLINEILDLSKIESGEMELSYETIAIKDLIENVCTVFEPIAKEKELGFAVNLHDNLPAALLTDQLRIEQVLRNLLSNAMKFTETGSVELDVFTNEETSEFDAGHVVFRVIDTGIGIPKEKQDLVFESFRQADGSTQRKFGGTGLGLSICRQISKLLGGSLTLKSTEGEGSIFTFTIPLNSPETGQPSVESVLSTAKLSEDDSRRFKMSKTHGQDLKTIVLITENREIIEECTRYSFSMQADLKVIKNSGIAAHKAAQFENPTVLIDPYTSHLSGWSIAKQILNENNPVLPVWMVTNHDSKTPAVDLPGVSGKISFPVEKDQLTEIIENPGPQRSGHESTLLLIDDNKMHNEALREFASDIVDRCLIAASAKEALEMLQTADVDCIVLDLTLPDATGQDVLKKLSEDHRLAAIPVIIYSGRSLTKLQTDELLTHASDVILKNVGSHSKLMNKISELIDNQAGHPPSDSKKKRSSPHTILVVDDDQQSYFSVSSLLQSENLKVHRAVNGKDALRSLQEHPETDLVLLDLMMPEMDGFETIKKIRENADLRSLPVFIVTAKAMKGDREECLRHGATEYISKPISPEKLEMLMSIWLK